MKSDPKLLLVRLTNSPGSSAACNTSFSAQAPDIFLCDNNAQTSTKNESMSNSHLLLLKQFEQQQSILKKMMQQIFKTMSINKEIEHCQVPDTSSAQQTYKPSSINKIETQGQVQSYLLN